jgi:hypothetical protein
MPPRELNRRTIYDLVWSKPMTQVAQDFGISDVALKKICVKHRVPTPARGYWAKKAAGIPTKQIRFVEAADPRDERIVIHGTASLPEPVRRVLAEARAERAAKPRPNVPVVAQEPKDERDLHPVVVATAKALRKAKPADDGSVSANHDGTCGIVVGPRSAERAISLLDAIARAFAQRGLSLVATGQAMSAAPHGETVCFALTEKVQREKHVPTAEELASEERRRKREMTTLSWSFKRSYPEWDFIRTGEFSLEIENRYVNGLRRTWKDGKTQRLENLVDDFVIGVMAYAAGARLERAKRERRHRNWERERRVQARAGQRRDREGERRKILDELVAISTEAAKLRTWLSEADTWSQPSQPNEFTRFVTWARSRLKYLEGVVGPDGIAERLRSRDLFPETDPLVDPPEDLVREKE